ncbi:hypothetical protein E8E11_009158 [Didymella keratinophila]|nr:hypothetical protein E8E11_009158 [Didymella keratinophila]
MSRHGGEVEWQPSVTGEPSAGTHSHTLRPSPEFFTHSLYLENLGAQFPPTPASRRESYDTHLSVDEALAQAEATAATPRADHSSWLPDSPSGGHLTGFPLTSQPSPAQELPYLTPSEYAQFERRRRAKKDRREKAFDPRRNALEATPRASPTATLCTSVLDSDTENDDNEPHMQTNNPEDYMSSQWSLNGREFEYDYQVNGQDGEFGPYLHQESHRFLPEDTYNSNAASGAMPTSVADPQTPGSEALQDHRP